MRILTNKKINNMKRIFTLLLGLVLLAGCSKSDDGSNDTDNTLVPIELGAGVNTPSRVVITPGDPVSGAGIAGWEVVSGGQVNYVVVPEWNTTISTTADPDPQTVSWGDTQYYDPDASTTTHMKAWYPGGTLQPDNKVTFNGQNVKGGFDVLLSDVVSGNKKDGADGNIAFRHMSAQIKFSVKKGAGLDDGTTIHSITIKEASLPTGFDLTKGIDDDGAVTYGGPDDLEIVCGDVKIDDTSDKGKSVGDPVMIKPIAAKQFRIDIVTNKASYTDQLVTVDDTEVARGTAYNILLTFTQAGISLKATVEDWKTADGSGNIQ